MKCRGQKEAQEGGRDLGKVTWPENYEARAQAFVCLQVANIMLSLLFPNPFSRAQGLFFSALVSICLFLSLTGAMATGRRRACTVPGLRLGTHPSMPPPQVPEENWQQAPHPPCIPASATSSAGGVIYRSLLPTYPSYWHCPGQRAEHRVFSTLCPGHSQAWGFSIGLERGGVGGTGRRP